ncbi:hypothetical protein SDC9_134212 [bioreactor metagenome]|uniref:Uncharacterized protein n=1 Tax=bioreactor metagenome TaxID=1076179 RepID=A0A645DD07_9ZZZZ
MFYVFIEANKLVRIIVVLFEKGRGAAQARANLFEVSARTIYRSTGTNNTVGIPVAPTRGKRPLLTDTEV